MTVALGSTTGSLSGVDEPAADSEADAVELTDPVAIQLFDEDGNLIDERKDTS